MRVLSLLLLSAALGAGPAVQAADEEHLDEAMKHVKEAAAADDGPSIAKHAELARSHAQTADEHLARSHAQTADEHLDAAIKSLGSAIEQGKLGQGDRAKKAADEARMHLKAVND
ncbi:Small metal-binding protein [Candidatus Methylobacter favarea]|uniref:Small metal-binding protein n=1 Tax=Candidatus Methylobacter favarea TaxID=2707345 RepID=A0A8S0XGA1_9GAMM|nr:small metal-binding protein SmbP [Candidatus Methylobacter favarea]CAA9890877.1 Small metal-binding protein [Candidatus Methylobacter favarea]